MWDGGTDMIWTYQGADGWYPLNAAQFPDFAATFRRVGAARRAGLLAAVPRRLQGSGRLSSCGAGSSPAPRPDWSLLVRPPANLARSQGYEHYEGIIETDRWFGPLFINVRLTRTNAPIEFDADFPFLQVQPIHRSRLWRCARPVRSGRRARAD